MLGDIESADALATDALAAYDRLDYEQGVQLAAAAHHTLMAAARSIHVEVDPETWRRQYRSPALRQDLRALYRAARIDRQPFAPASNELARATSETTLLAPP